MSHLRTINNNNQTVLSNSGNQELASSDLMNLDPDQLKEYLNINNFGIAYEKLSDNDNAPIPGSQLLTLTRDNIIEICGKAVGIRLYNFLNKK